MAPALLLILTLLWSNNHIHLQNDNHPFEWICQILTTVGSFYEIFLHMKVLVVFILMFSGRHPLAPNREMSVPFERSHTVTKSLPCAYKWNVLTLQPRKVEWSMVYINCQCYDSMIIYLPGASFDRAYVQLIEVRSGIIVLSITIRLYIIDDHFVSINSKFCLQRTKCKLQKMN